LSILFIIPILCADISSTKGQIYAKFLISCMC
jgi:hypothetical protein